MYLVNRISIKYILKRTHQTSYFVYLLLTLTDSKSYNNNVE